MSTIKLEHGVPLPAKTRTSTGSVYPLNEMQKGDSFVIEGDRKPSAVRSSLYHRALAAGKRLAVAPIMENGAQVGVRVWCIGTHEPGQRNKPLD